MLYLLEPSLTVLCNHDTGSTAALKRARADPQVDLAELRWLIPAHPVERRLLLELALIQGIPCTRGIVVDGVLFGIVSRGQPKSGEGIKPIHVRSKVHQQAVDDWLGTSPSAIRHRQAAADRFAAQQALDQHRAEEQANRLLGAAPNQALLRHWLSLGGAEPV